jgi:hypothetical protein
LSTIEKASRATILHMKQGFVERIECFQVDEDYSAHVTHRVYIHRRRPSLIIQYIDIFNPTERTLEFHLEVKRSSMSNHLKQLDEQNIQIGSLKEFYRMITNQLPMKQHMSLIFVIITSKSPTNSFVKSGRYVSMNKQNH